MKLKLATVWTPQNNKDIKTYKSYRHAIDQIEIVNFPFKQVFKKKRKLLKTDALKFQSSNFCMKNYFFIFSSMYFQIKYKKDFSQNKS